MTQRNDLADIARGALILLVVWGHLLEGKGFNNPVYFAIYTFHMPAFAMLSGMFSKATLRAKDFPEIIAKFVLPLIAFQLAYFFALGAVSPDRVTTIYTPAWIVWFLFSLVIWKVLLPVIVKLRYAFTLSFIAALIAGYFDEITNAWSLSRTFVFFPAFLFGHLYKDRIFAAAIRFRASLSVVFFAIMSGALLLSGHVDIQLLWGAQSYADMHFDSASVLFRAATIVIGLVASVGFFAVLPSRSPSLLHLGKETLPIYLLHGFPVMLFWKAGILPDNNLLFLLLTAGLALVISFAIARAASPLPSIVK